MNKKILYRLILLLNDAFGDDYSFSDYYEATKYRVLFVNPGDEKNQYNFLIEKINQNAP